MIHMITVLIFCAIGLISCKKDDKLIEKEKYIYDIPAVKLSSDAKVGAYYLNYATTDWAKVQPDTSLLGKPYNAVTDATIFPQQLTWADEAGVDYLIFKYLYCLMAKPIYLLFC